MSMNLDINTLRSAVTGISFLIFIGIMVWAYRPARKTEFDEAAQLPFSDASGRGWKVHHE